MTRMSQPNKPVANSIVLLFSIFCLLSSLAFTAGYLGYSGIIFHGLDKKAGTFRSGQKFNYVITAVNTTFGTIHISVVPTCGCATNQLEEYNIKPLTRIEIPVGYTSANLPPGPRRRDVLLIVHSGNVVRRVTGTVSFTIE